MYNWVVLLILFILFTAYGSLMIYYWVAWKSIPTYHPGTNTNLSLSVIIPARNEEEHIGPLLNALNAQEYPASNIDLIIVDDHSSDRTADIIRQHPSARLLQLTEDALNSYKKKALEQGIAAATAPLIVTTDADCLPSPSWLHTIATFKQQHNSAFIAAPVSYIDGSSLLSIFQSLDFLVLQGITGASVHRNILSMCNGANLAYERSAFEEVDGFSGIDHIASGDDMLLMHKIWKKYPQRVHFLKSRDAIVQTHAMKTWRLFLHQRIRWASKATKYDDKRILAVLMLVYFFNLSLLATAVLGFFEYHYWYILLLLWIAKTIIELPFVISVASFFQKNHLLKYFFFFQPVHILYTIVSGLFGQFGKYEWKGRMVR